MIILNNEFDWLHLILNYCTFLVLLEELILEYNINFQKITLNQFI